MKDIPISCTRDGTAARPSIHLHDGLIKKEIVAADSYAKVIVATLNATSLPLI